MNKITEDTYNQELKICQEESMKNGGKCNWGKCQECGVIPLLYKLKEGELIDNPDEANKLKSKYLNIDSK